MLASRIAALAAGAALFASGAVCASDETPDSSSRARLQLAWISRYDFESKEMKEQALTAEELSGFVRMDDSHYLAIGDAHACVHRLTIRIDGSGKILSASLDRPLLLRDGEGRVYPDATQGEDREGIIYDPKSRSVWISNERTAADKRWSSIERHRLSDGKLTALTRWDSDPMLGVYAHARRNRGWESLTRSEDGTEVWTGNEEALDVDGPMATDKNGGVVRLQKFDGTMHPVAQYAYLVDPYPAKIKGPLILEGKEISGLSELLVISKGRLLALERAFAGDSTGEASLRSRIYLVETDGATDVSQGDLRTGLLGRDCVPVKKTLLWEKNWGLSNSNFEGMALGPSLPGGGQVLFLVADNNVGTSQSLVSLHLTGTAR
jgi:hypothetical protein